MSQQPSTSDWLTEESVFDLATLLWVCETPEMLQDLRAIAPAESLRMAARILPKTKQQLLRQWIEVTKNTS